MRAWFVAALAALALTAGFPAAAEDARPTRPDFRPAALYNESGRLDHAFNESVLRGVERFRQETGIAVRETPATDQAHAERALRSLAEQGYSPILVAGFTFAQAVQSVAPRHPNQQFILIDAVVPADNVQSVMFKEHEGSFLVGVLAAMKSKSGVIGFVGGMDSPPIRRFACGYVQGAKAIRPDVTVLQDMIGTTYTAWNNTERAQRLAEAQMGRGADIIYAAAGGAGLGALAAAAEAGRFGIGVDSNQNALYPGHILTSMLKRVDIATYRALRAASQGRWAPGNTVLGLAEDGVGWAQDQHNALIISDDMFGAVEFARQKVVQGDIKVHDSSSDGICPAAVPPLQWQPPVPAR